MLAKSQSAVVAVSSAAEALVVCESQKGDVQLVVTDVSMPKMNGFELAERIAERWPAIPVLFVTGCADDLSVRRQLCGRPVLSKPFTADALSQKVREMLTPAARGQAIRTAGSS